MMFTTKSGIIMDFQKRWLTHWNKWEHYILAFSGESGCLISFFVSIFSVMSIWKQKNKYYPKNIKKYFSSWQFLELPHVYDLTIGPVWVFSQQVIVANGAILPILGVPALCTGTHPTIGVRCTGCIQSHVRHKPRLSCHPTFTSAQNRLRTQQSQWGGKWVPAINQYSVPCAATTVMSGQFLFWHQK